MAVPTPPLTNARPPAEKLMVVRFLNAHLAQGGIDLHGYDLLHRMVLLISATGRDLQSIIQADITHASVVKAIERYVTCVLQGCDVFQRHIEMRAAKAEAAAQELGRLDGVKEDRLMEGLRTWDTKLRALHVPTGNDRRLFKHIATHYDTAAYRHFLRLHRKKPENELWSLRETFTAIQQRLESIRGLCKSADRIVRHLDEEFDAANIRLKRWARSHMQPIIEHEPTSTAGARRDIEEPMFALPKPKASPYPDKPPRLPLLPFQRPNNERPRHDQNEEIVRTGSVGKRPVMNKSFSTVEDHVARPSSHFRYATLADNRYVADAADVGLGIAASGRPEAVRAPTVGVRRKGSASKVPRVFTGSFNELQADCHKLKLHRVKTPEEPRSPTTESTAERPVKIRDFAETPETGSICPSPATLLQRREALVSKEPQWETRVVNGEVVRCRRPSGRAQQHRAQTLDNRSGGLEAWIGSELEKARSSPEMPGSAKRGMLRQRENTL